MSARPLNPAIADRFGQLAQLSIERMADAVLFTDDRGRIFYANAAAYRLFEDEPEQLLNRHLWQLNRDLSAETWPAYWEQLQTCGSLETEATYRARDRQNIFVETTTSYLSADDTAYSCTVCRPLTERAIAAREVRQAREQLRAVLDAVPGFVSWIDAEGRYLGVNRHLAASYNMPPEAFVGKELGFLKNSPEFVDFVRAFLQSNQLYESQVVKASVRGNHRYYIIAAQKYDERRATVVVGVDITDRKRSEEALQDSEARLIEKTEQLEEALRERQRAEARLIQSEKMYALGQMVAGMAHEINNPINFIYGNLSYADNYVRDLLGLMQLYREQLPELTPTLQAEIESIDLDFIASDLPKIVDSMKMGAERILKLVMSLRNFSRLDEAEFKRANLQDGLDSALAILNHRIQGKIEIVKEYRLLPPIYCYPAQLNQVWMNLLCNAIDAVSDPALQEERTPRITVTTEVLEKDRILVKIIDNGRGIPAKIREKIFDPFFTTKVVGRGTGLGLSICYQVIETHGGRLDFISESDRGTEFLVELPVVPFRK